jgi:hypothetical protein
MGFINGINGPSAHDPDDPDVGRIFETRGPGQVSASIGAPVAEKSYYPWLKLGFLFL